MKKSLLLVSLLAIALVACSKKEEAPAPTTEVVVVPAAEAPAPVAPEAATSAPVTPDAGTPAPAETK